MRNSQAWSLDVMLAVVIFLGTIFFFYAILNTAQGDKSDELRAEASKVLERVLSESSDASIAEGNKINSTKLQDLLGNYSGIKGKLRVKNDFCIYFEDEDGNIMYINASYTGFGSTIINVSGSPCG